MQFSVIYSVDVPPGVRFRDVRPPNFEKRDAHGNRLWEITENGDSDVGACLDEKWWIHRKYCGILNRDEFHEFVTHCNLEAESCETMGSIGAPGFGFSCAPAISFQCRGSSHEANAYVTPVPGEHLFKRFPDRDLLTEKFWGRARAAILNLYGY